MDFLQFAAYLILFSGLITKVGFFRKSGLSSTQLILLFLIKVIAGVLYGWLGSSHGLKLQMFDTWYFHNNGLKEYQQLLNQPTDFFSSFFHNEYDSSYFNFLNSTDSWWNNIKYLFFNKLLALFNFFSFGNYYINVIIYSFISLFGPIAIYRVLTHEFPNNEHVLQATVFLIPSFLFWTSGIHKEGLVFLSFALISYQFYFGFKHKKITGQQIVIILLAFLLLILRSFVIIVLLPALFAWYISERTKYKTIYVFGTIYIVFITLFFTIQHVKPEFNLMQSVVTRQQEFMSLHGNSSVNIKPLEVKPISFLKNAPQAISLSILRPYPTDVHHIFSLASCIETIFFLTIFLLFLFFRKREKKLTPFLLYSFVLSISMLFMIGYTVNILGAIVRYRSIILPFLIAPMVAMIDWKRLRYIK